MTKVYVGKFPKEIVMGGYTDAWLFSQFQEFGMMKVANNIDSGRYGDIRLFTFNLILLDCLSRGYVDQNVYYYNFDTETIERISSHDFYDDAVMWSVADGISQLGDIKIG